MPGSLDDLAVFVAIARVGTVSGAALKLHSPKSSVSRALARLEAALGEQLVQRTTRRSRLSAAGEALLARAEPLVAALEENLAPRAGMQAPSGLLRITCTIDFGAMVVAELVARFIARYPTVQVEVHGTNSIVDLVAGGFDLGLRVSGKRGLRDSTLVARRVGTLHTQLVASPSYLARRSAPRNVRDLREHDWVTYGGAQAFLQETKGASKNVPIRSRIQCDDMFFARAAARAGAGIALLPSFLAEPEISAGSLIAVLPKWQLATGALWLVHPPARNLPAKVSAFRDLVVEALGAG
ncbi:MAG: LysR family transcriptional regulator [Pseudomonadota bacterium]